MREALQRRAKRTGRGRVQRLVRPPPELILVVLLSAELFRFSLSLWQKRSRSNFRSRLGERDGRGAYGRGVFSAAAVTGVQTSVNGVDATVIENVQLRFSERPQPPRTDGFCDERC